MTAPVELELAASHGHQLRWDPPASGLAERWTCRRCGRAVLRSRSQVYGSAVSVRCDGPELVEVPS